MVLIQLRMDAETVLGIYFLPMKFNLFSHAVTDLPTQCLPLVFWSVPNISKRDPGLH